MLQFVLFLVAMVIIIIITLFVVKLRKTTQEEWEKFKQKQERETALLKSVTDVDRGDWAERKTVLTLLNLGLKPTAIFHDLYVKVGEGRYSQIDLVVATKVGILVFEIKDYSGWIFGKGSQSYWTQVLAYGEEKHRFYNPIKQNIDHIKVLNKAINYKYKINSLIVFASNNFDNDKLDNVINLNDFESYIINFKNDYTLSKDEIDNIFMMIKDYANR